MLRRVLALVIAALLAPVAAALWRALDVAAASPERRPELRVVAIAPGDEGRLSAELQLVNRGFEPLCWTGYGVGPSIDVILDGDPVPYSCSFGWDETRLSRFRLGPGEVIGLCESIPRGRRVRFRARVWTPDRDTVPVESAELDVTAALEGRGLQERLEVTPGAPRERSLLVHLRRPWWRFRD